MFEQWPASMGPPPFGRWKQLDRADPLRPCMDRLASMGPPPFGSGNSARYGGVNLAQWPVLQWGHRLSAVETSEWNGQGVDGDWYPALQWGHRLSAVETAICALTRTSTRGIVRLPPQIPLGHVAGSSQLNTHFVVCSRSVARGVTGHLHHWTSRKTPACLPPIILSPPPCGAVRGRFPG